MWKILKQITQTGIVSETVTPDKIITPSPEHDQIQQELLQLLGRALCIRAVDAGSCNACELELHALNNPYYNLEGMGIKFVASPRHADLLLVTGPICHNMREALLSAYDAMPHPKLVIALGECACTGGIFKENYATGGALEKHLPVDLSIPGCPPAPITILRGIKTLLTTSTAAPHHPAQAQSPALTESQPRVPSK